MSALRKTSATLAILILTSLLGRLPAGAQKAVLGNLHGFTGNDGSQPLANLIQGADGNFYGTTFYGGSSNGNGASSNSGTIFQFTPGGTLNTLHVFTGGADGGNPAAALLQTSDGAFYGTTYFGGVNSAGTVFKITSTGSLTTLHSFAGAAEGSGPQGTLIQGTDGNFYGTTTFGGPNSSGTIFKMTSSGTLTVLYAFTGGSDGSNPAAGLVQGKDGNFYGTAYYGGANGFGAVYQVTPGGTQTILHNFNGTDGANPHSALIVGQDGNFYGTTNYGGQDDDGTVFSMTIYGALTTLHFFYGGDGFNPQAPLIQGKDGSFYGTAVEGGLYNQGSIFRVTAGGIYRTLYAFTGGTDGANPSAAILQAGDGRFYTITNFGGANNFGAIDRFTIVTPADFNGDNQTDLVFQNTTTGQLATWFLNGATVIGGAYIYPMQSAAWQCVGVGDFNADGQSDLVFQNTTTGQISVWFMNPSFGNYALSATVITPTQDPSWKCVSVNDFNGDSQPDLLFQNTTTGQLAIWYMNGTTVAGAAYITPSQDPQWRCVGSGDFNGDGQPDLIFENVRSGQLVVWYLNGTAATNGAFIGIKADPNWQVVGVGDFTGDGQSDFMMEHVSGSILLVKFLKGTDVPSGTVVEPSQDPNWRIVGPR